MIFRVVISYTCLFSCFHSVKLLSSFMIKSIAWLMCLLMMDSDPTPKRLRRTLEARDTDNMSEPSHGARDDQMIKVVIGLRHICRQVKGNDYVQQRTYGDDFLYIFIFHATMLSDVTVAFVLEKVREKLCARHQIYVGRAEDLTLRHYGREPIESANSLEDVLRALCHQQIRNTEVFSDDGDMLFLWVDFKTPVRELTASEKLLFNL